MELDIYRKLRNSICVLGVGTSKVWNYADDEIKPNEMGFNIIGTGFLVEENLVATNRHVLDALHKEDNDWITAIFISSSTDGSLSFKYRKLGVRLTITTNREYGDMTGHTLATDVALIRIIESETADDVHRPVQFGKKEDIQIGRAIRACGYIHGNTLLGSNSVDKTVVRFSPMLMHGYISGIAPFDNLPGHELNLILTDMTNGGGLSGSPLVTDDGKVIGIHCAGLSETVLIPAGNGNIGVTNITKGIGFSVPFFEEKSVNFIGVFKEAEKSMSKQMPKRDEVI